jgi:hypothetical protein
MKRLEVGRSWQISYFDPVKREAAGRLIRVVGRESIEYRGKPVECFVLTAHPLMGSGAEGKAGAFGAASSRAWVSVQRGELLREEVRMLVFRLALVLEESVTAEERNYRRRMDPRLPGGGPGGGPRKRAKAGGGSRIPREERQGDRDR